MNWSPDVDSRNIRKGVKLTAMKLAQENPLSGLQIYTIAVRIPNSLFGYNRYIYIGVPPERF